MRRARDLIQLAGGGARIAGASVVATAIGLCIGQGSALAGVEDWRVNEVASSVAGNPNLRFVELYAPPSIVADMCFFPSTRIEILSADGDLLGSVTPFTSTTCFGGNTLFLFATPETEAHYGVVRDAALPYPIPAAGQLCFRSSATRYDCARWGDVTGPVPDFGNPADMTAAAPLVDGAAIARIAVTGVVATEFALRSPTPRRGNDGTPWMPPDAGPPLDASVTPDAGEPDARFVSDARIADPIDARPGAPDWYHADPGGAPACAVAPARRSARPSALLAFAALALLAVTARRRSGRLPEHAPR
ncbi:MAG: hypothetical protein EXR73_08215 [Myxococcales bacterium]|nr:hypothetical protein [Myxococcales bacterium]